MRGTFRLLFADDRLLAVACALAGVDARVEAALLGTTTLHTGLPLATYVIVKRNWQQTGHGLGCRCHLRRG